MERATIVTLKPKEEDRILRGHPWIYDNEIAKLESLGDMPSGSEVTVRSSRGRLLGSGLWSPKSKIRVRLHSRGDERCDAAFLRTTVRRAAAVRSRVRDMERDSCRILFGEADGIPGVVADLFRSTEAGNDGTHKTGAAYLSVQILSAALETRRELLLDALADTFHPAGIVERSDAPVRALEGLANRSCVARGTVPDRVVIAENNLKFAVDLTGGQKTGWFLDQRDNRAAVAKYAAGRDVLDAFCNAGGFGLCAARSGATSVVALDSSEDAVAQVRANAALNGFESSMQTVSANAFDYLRDLGKSGRRFGLIVLDPPAFAKSRAALEGARRGYKEINLRAMKLLAPGGILATFSCSFWVGRERFREVVEDAAADSGMRFRLLETRTQAPDHPIVIGYPESEYLKCLILEAL